MKAKLKAIWRILRCQSFFYTCHIDDRYISDHELGNQPKGMVPAYRRVDVMFEELDKLTAVAKHHIQCMNERYRKPAFERI